MQAKTESESFYCLSNIPFTHQSVSRLVTDWLVILFSTFESKTAKMRTPAIIFVIFPILSLVHSANIGGRDGEDPDEEEPTSDVPVTLGFTGRSLHGLGRAAAIGNQEEAAGSQTLPDRPPGVPPLPFFNRPPTNSVALPVREKNCESFIYYLLMYVLGS